MWLQSTRAPAAALCGAAQYQATRGGSVSPTPVAHYRVTADSPRCGKPECGSNDQRRFALTAAEAHMGDRAPACGGLWVRRGV